MNDIPQIAHYAITQTILPHFNKFKAVKQFEKITPRLTKLLRKVCLEYSLIVEMTQKANVHYHILVKWRDNTSMDEYLDSVRSLGHAMIKKIFTSNADWEKYMLKDTERTLNILNMKSKVNTYRLNHIYKKWTFKPTLKIDDLLPPYVHTEGFIKHYHYISRIVTEYNNELNKEYLDK